jgi:hypothetical protein
LINLLNVDFSMKTTKFLYGFAVCYSCFAGKPVGLVGLVVL